MPCGDTGHHSVLWACICWVWEVQTRMLHWQAVDPLPRDYFPYALEEGWQEIIPECLLNWAKGVPNVRGESLHKLPLLL